MAVKIVRGDSSDQKKFLDRLNLAVFGFVGRIQRLVIVILGSIQRWACPSPANPGWNR